ncbi:glycosyltransferase family 2 protein [Vibrio sp. 03-59-1]|uniref:glycosyltransferase family 2 protein n=1 Tax=Vibrio sp. 03-59-1 TaxID=2607607 RepID=UPI00149361B0|nr:glycosyltransferase [Vibrio sp. 03-59-1]NOH84558.1 glycosyltransferase family 2 protein [Vibrio sp. 03-59-1]
MKSNPLISIITPSYNCADTLQATADSILSQTHNHWEWLITDDCSDVATQKKLSQLEQSDSRIHVFFSEINGGAAIARNHSLSQASGEFIAFLDSDDLWLPTKLERQIEFMNDSIDFSFTAYEIINEEGVATGQLVDANQEGEFTYQQMLQKQATLGCSTVMLRRCAFQDISMPLLRTGQDYALWLKLLKTGAKASVLAKPFTQYRIMPNSISRNKVKKARRQWQIYRKVEQLSFITSVYCFGFYAWRAVFRR